MLWIISIAALIVFCGTITALFVWTAKTETGRPVPGQFDFRRYKSLELSQRGLFDKTRWP
ncbi:hypothetical protein [Solidesulfovibrio sp.]